MRVLFLIWLTIASCVASEKTAPRFDNLTIVVSSCDKFSEFWHPFFTCLLKQWPSLQTQNTHIPLILISNQKAYMNQRVISSQLGADRGWSDNMLHVLKDVKTKYVLYLQEDYIFNSPVNEHRLSEILNEMENEGVACVQVGEDSFFRDHPAHPSLQGVVVKGKHDLWRASLQAAIWRKDVFEWLIKPKENPWVFEDNASVRSQGTMRPFWAVINNFPITYLNACDRGFWKNDALTYIKSQGIDIPGRTLPDEENNWFSCWIAQKKRVYQSLIRKLTKILFFVFTILITALVTRLFCRGKR